MNKVDNWQLGDLQPAYVLHSRPLRNTSIIADVFSMHTGRLSVCIKGARKTQGRKPAKQHLIQPFLPLRMSFTGHSGRLFVQQMETVGAPMMLQHTALYSAMYMNELLLRLLAVYDPHPHLFAFYQTGLQRLQHVDDIEPGLREFENYLMDELGYRVDLSRDYLTGEAIKAHAYYVLQPLQGLSMVLQDAPLRMKQIPGHVLLELATPDLASKQARQVSKYIARTNLARLLGNKPLKTRELFHKMQYQTKPDNKVLAAPTL